MRVFKYSALMNAIRADTLRDHCKVQYGVDIYKNNGCVNEDDLLFLKKGYRHKGAEH